ncbi:Tho complex subunit 7-domain-containing protein [Schizophyllum commune]
MGTSTPAPQAEPIFPPMTAEEEDHVILTRLHNDERILRTLIKTLHAYLALAAEPPTPNTASQLEDARDAFLIKLESFELTLQKMGLVCVTEDRQVSEYQREREAIDNEHQKLHTQIEELKGALERAQVSRRQKMEYDAIAEKVNTLPSRDELEGSIEKLESDMAAIREEHLSQDRMLQTQRTGLDAIVAELEALRRAAADEDPSGTPAEDVEDSQATILTVTAGDADGAEDGAIEEEGAINEDGAIAEEGAISEPGAIRESEPRAIRETARPVAPPLQTDIEMGEVEEKKDEREEGEASDMGSPLTDLQSSP